MVSKEVRTRFNPSPTGYLHVGNVRTALYAWLWARHNHGKFFFRIEDTDQARFLADAEDQIKRSMEWLGMDWEPDVWHQSERLDIYLKKALELVEQGKAYIADDSDEDVKKARDTWQAAKPETRGLLRYPSRESPVSSDKYDSSQGHVIRFLWPENPSRMDVEYFHGAGDRRESGVMSVDPETAPSAFEDFILIKSDGFPTYNFAHIIDDHHQEITDVIRGDEFTPSLNKYYALYDAMGWESSRPRYYHVPTILGPDGKSKLSKRSGAVDVLGYRDKGYLPTALVNFLVLIGWSPGGDRELFFAPEELIETFNLGGIQKSPGVFDENKLRWMNKEHMKQRDLGDLLTLAKADKFWPEDEKDLKKFELALERASTLADLTLDSYYTSRPKLAKKELVGDESPETVGVWIERSLRHLEGVSEWTPDRLKTSLQDVLNKLNLVPKQLYPVLRVALTGAPQTPPIWDVMEVLGKTESLERLEAAEALMT